MADRARRLEELVEHQARRWALEARAPERVLPCIALSRHAGSGAAELGQQLADKLDYGFFDIQLLDQIARELGIQRRLLDALDEHSRSAVERFVMDAFRTGTITESDYIRCVVKTIGALGERGRAVILGRGAPFILPAERTLRVLVVAPLEMRAERVARERGISRDEAKTSLAREDAERRAFLAHHFRVDPDNPVLYDVTVNTGTLGQDAALALVLDALRCRFPR
jgi:cytidylate kinase